MLRSAVFAAVGVLVTVGSLSAQTPAPSPPAAPPPAAETPNGPEPMEDVQTGDHWTYQVRDDITGDIKSTTTYTVTDTSASEVSIRFSLLGNPIVGYQTFDRNWNLTNNGIWRLIPNDGTGIRPPLAVGKSWSFKNTALNTKAGNSLKRSGTAKVVAQESVTTSAGTFDTFKIETTLQEDNAADATKKLLLVQQTWYAPAIDHWVKRSSVTRSDGRVRDRNTMELVEYGRR